MMVHMQTRSWVVLLLLVPVLATADTPARVTAGTLPAWWPKDEFAYSGTRPVHAEDYAEASFRTGANEKDKTAVRGRHWIADLVRTKAEEKAQPVDAEAKWNRVRTALERDGFKIVWSDDKPSGSWIHATLRRGDGDRATWVWVELSRPFNTGEMEAVTVAPDPLTVELRQPAATPETFTDKQQFPYLVAPPGARMTGSEHWNHAMTFFTGEKGHDEIVIGTGYITKSYVPDPTISALAFHDAYVAALQKAGWTVMPAAHAGFDISAVYDKNGRDLYAHLTRETFSVADVGSELAAALAKSCKASVYGINFDFDKATLRPDSTPTLEQVLRVLKGDAKLHVEVGGHTDNVGKPDYNLTLSDHRAATVKDWLVSHGIAAARLTSHGYGDTQPLVKNDSEEHRAENRRVELKKPDCK